MRRLVFLIILTICATKALADERDDAVFFMAHFIEERDWDLTYRRTERRGVALYSEALLSRNIVVIDPDRFRDMMPDTAVEEAIEQLKSHVAEFVIQGYGKDNLSQIVDFFQTPTGERMLAIARAIRLFERLHSQSPDDGPGERWETYLSIDDLVRYSAFIRTRAGQVFVQQTWTVRRALHYEIHEKSHWAELPLNPPYFIEIIEAGGILKFPNRAARDALLSELIAAIN